MKIGIITHYYKSENYGGNLQAYALCKIVEKMGHSAEQISFDRNKNAKLMRKIKRAIINLQRCMSNSFHGISKNLRTRSKAFYEFNQVVIPHSNNVYSPMSIANCTNDYDVFITGSDQVWNPQAVCDAYLLKFVTSDKIKMSYAASLSCSELDSVQKQRYSDAFFDYSAISVREEDAVTLVKDLTPLEVKYVLDPVLLIPKQEWLNVASPIKMSDDYLFCYFLGENPNHRKIAEDYARSHNLKIATLPYLTGKFHNCDKNFGDVRMYNVSPQNLIALINGASCIFTDSFHVSAFSLLLEKEHIIFPRHNSNAMSTRIYSLCSMFGTQDHFCDDNIKQSVDYIETLHPIDYSTEFSEFERAKENSYKFLQSILNK